MFDGWLFRRHVEDDEHIVRIIHKHWLLGLRVLFRPTVSFLLSWVFLYFVPFKSVFFAVALWSIVSLVWWLRNFFDYYLDAWVITDHGIIDLEWHGWFHRQSARVLYSDIQGVSYEIQGFLGSVLYYGTVAVEKISTGTTISLDHVHDPRKVEGVILRGMEAYLHSKNLKDARHVQELLAGFVATQVQLKDFRSDDE